MELLPYNNGFSIDTQKIFLHLPSNERVGVDRILRGSRINSKTQNPIIPESRPHSLQLEKDVKTTFGLAFQITPPEPEEVFFLEIEGLSFSGQHYPVPRIRFEKKIWAGTLR
jgi:hypothetical protein